MMENVPRLQTRYELAQSTADSFREIWISDSRYRFNQEAMDYYKRCRMAGIPFDYLDLSPEDYQSTERDALHQTLRFIKSIDYQWRSGGGLRIAGLNGAGKSLLSYLVAKAAVYGNVPTICISLIEYIEKRRLEKVQPNLILELIKQLENSRVVIIDDFGKEYGGAENWFGYEASTALYNIFKEGTMKAVVINTALLDDEFATRVGTSYLSRASGYPHIYMEGKDFRELNLDSVSLVSKAQNDKNDHRHCWLKHPVLADETVGSLGQNCSTCKYRFRPKLCLLRFEKHWIELEQR